MQTLGAVDILNFIRKGQQRWEFWLRVLQQPVDFGGLI